MNILHRNTAATPLLALGTLRSMARILAISSQVARGHVGLSIVVPALQALGHEAIALPTVVLSNHPGHAHVAGTRIEPAVLHKMLDALEANGWLAGIDGVLTGYLPSEAHVAFAAEAVGRARAASPRLIYLCDPVLGDDPKGLYIDEAAARATRDRLIGLADIATPNRFELSYLNSAHATVDVRSAADALNFHLACATTVATSIPSHEPGKTMNAMYSRGATALTSVALREGAPHGTGDLFSALLLSAFLDRPDVFDALALATAGVDAVLAASTGGDELAIAALPGKADAPLSWPIAQAAAGTDGQGSIMLPPRRPAL